MDDTAQFVCDLNVARFVEKLWSEHDPHMRVSLKKLLVEEEDKFGRDAERLSNLQRYIAEGSRRITSQKSLIRRLRANGNDSRMAEITLTNLIEIQRLFEHYLHMRAQLL
jgi:hypothetical protein